MPGEGRWRLMWNSVSCDPQTVACTSLCITASLWWRRWPPAAPKAVASPPLRVQGPPRPPRPRAPRTGCTAGPSPCSSPSPTLSLSGAGPRSCPMCWSAACCCGWLRTGFTPSACARAACTGRARWPRTQTNPTSWRKSRPASWWTRSSSSQVRDLTAAGTESAALQPRCVF